MEEEDVDEGVVVEREVVAGAQVALDAESVVCREAAWVVLAQSSEEKEDEAEEVEEDDREAAVPAAEDGDGACSVLAFAPASCVPVGRATTGTAAEAEDREDGKEVEEEERDGAAAAVVRV